MLGNPLVLVFLCTSMETIYAGVSNEGRRFPRQRHCNVPTFTASAKWSNHDPCWLRLIKQPAALRSLLWVGDQVPAPKSFKTKFESLITKQSRRRYLVRNHSQLFLLRDDLGWADLICYSQSRHYAAEEQINITIIETGTTIRVGVVVEILYSLLDIVTVLH